MQICGSRCMNVMLFLLRATATSLQISFPLAWQHHG